jgi:SAM-dependent methyltransferase
MKTGAEMKLHLGCGENYRNGWVNVDFEGDHIDQAVDLSKFPWPWDNNSVDEVFLEQVIEHFQRPEFVLKEIHRILKPGGRVELITPHKESISACIIDHKALMTRRFFEAFCDPDHYWIKQNQNCWFHEISYRVLIIKKPWLKWTPFDWFASRYACFWEKFSFGALRPGEIIWVAEKPVPSDL